MTAEVVDFLISTKKKGVGLDTIGLDPIAAAALPLHRQLLWSDPDGGRQKPNGNPTRGSCEERSFST